MKNPIKNAERINICTHYEIEHFLSEDLPSSKNLFLVDNGKQACKKGENVGIFLSERVCFHLIAWEAYEENEENGERKRRNEWVRWGEKEGVLTRIDGLIQGFDHFFLCSLSSVLI